MASQTYAVVDLETTGHSSKNGDRMMQIAIVFVRDWQVVDTFTTFINPKKSIPLFIQDLTHITNADVKQAQPFEAHAEHIYELLQNCVFVAHNTDFDLPFLQQEFKRVGLAEWYGKKIDTVELAKILFPTALSYRLGDLASELNIPLANAHRADEDALATAKIFIACWQKLLSLPQVTLEQLHKRAFHLKTDVAPLFFAALQQKRKTLAQEPYMVYQHIAVQPPVQPSTSKESLVFPHTEEEKIVLMKTHWPRYEKRPAQFTMMDAIYSTLSAKKEIVIEASTGIGKTLAYLLPAITHARKHNKQVAISVYTSHLLEQLLFEELPKAEQMLQTKVDAVILKGRQHYIDIARLTQIMAYDNLSYEETLTLAQVLVWLTATESGDVNELNTSGGGQLFIDKLRKDATKKSPVPADFDFYARAIEQSKSAELIITNHAMVLTEDIRHDKLFANVDAWIMDEAHQFIQAATQREQQVLSYTKWKYHLGQIGLIEDDKIFAKFYAEALKQQRVSMHHLQQLESTYIRLLQSFDNIVAQLTETVQRQTKKDKKYDHKRILFMQDINMAPAKYHAVSKLLQKWVDLAEQATTQFMQNTDTLTPKEQYMLTNWQYWIDTMKLQLRQWDAIFTLQQHESTWLELDLRSVPSSLKITQKPLVVAQALQQVMAPLRQQAAIVWTSGTMTLPQQPRFITEQLGIADSVEMLQLQAPKSYYAGATAYIVTDMPDIKQVSQGDYIEEVAHAVVQTVRATEGRSFVLFTSQDMLRKTVELIQESELLEDYMLFAQGMTNGSRMRILKSFQKFKRAVLFGTNSFWEGVDVPGDALASVIVVRLPFSAPDSPLFKARAEALQQQGKNSFNELSLPEALIRFKQGFGRLIRSSQDRGAFIVLDRRIDTKSYGKAFIRALPNISVHKVTLSNMVLQLESWYNKKDEGRKQVDDK